MAINPQPLKLFQFLVKTYLDAKRPNPSFIEPFLQKVVLWVLLLLRKITLKLTETIFDGSVCYLHLNFYKQFSSS